MKTIGVYLPKFCKKNLKIPKGYQKTIQWSKRKRTNNDLQNTIHKTKDRATRIPQPG